MRSSVFFNVFKILPSLIHLAEALFGGGTGPQKKAAVIDAVSSIVVAGGEAVVANNPHYSEAIGAAIDTLVPALIPKGQA